MLYCAGCRDRDDMAADREAEDDAARRRDGPAAEAPIVGADGLATLALACLVAAATFGASLLAALWHVARVARAAPARAVVLGLRLPPGGEPCADFRARLDRAHALAARLEGLTVVLLGGPTTPGLPSEAEAGRRDLVAAGLAPARIAAEARSRHTLENLRNYRAAFAPAPPAAPDLLVTSRFHLARATLMARSLGLRHIPCAAEDRLRPAPRLLLRLGVEAFLVHWYVVGRGFARLTRNRGMLARIG
jgi:uncharacterized SAM-binding protein YcdF (DUF218 family)